MSKTDQPRSSDAVEIEKERQKTKRYFLFILTFAALAVVGIVVVFRDSESGGARKVDIDLKEGKLSLSVDKPIVEQANIRKSSYETPQGTIEYTAGEVDKSLLKDLPNYESIQPTTFTGKNFINREAGFLLSVDRPEMWSVAYNPTGFTNPVTSLNTITTGDGSHLNINLERLPAGMDVEGYVAASLQMMMTLGVINQLPEVSYDDASASAFLYYVNPLTDGRTYQKFIIRQGVAYVATANYNLSLSDPARVNELISMVSTFALIGDGGEDVPTHSSSDYR